MFRAWRLGPFALTLLLAHSGCSSRSPHLTWVQGGIERGPQDTKQIALEFTGGGFAEGGDHILDVLKQHGIKASFFFTGDFFRTEEFAPVIRRVVNEGHYLGIHSDRHLLYCPWEDRNITLVEKDDFVKDLRDCQKELVRFGADPAKNIYWIPPYEWYNDEISRWSDEMGLVLINYSPGSLSNADYTEEADKRFRSSELIYKKIFEKEESDPKGLSGFLLLLHIGAGPGRQDKFFLHLDPLVTDLKARGYSFVRVDEMLEPYVRR